MAKLYAIIPANNINAWVRYHYNVQSSTKKKSDTQVRATQFSLLLFMVFFSPDYNHHVAKQRSIDRQMSRTQIIKQMWQKRQFRSQCLHIGKGTYCIMVDMNLSI